MLLGAGRHHTSIDGGIDTIHNYYESQVIDEIARTSERARKDHDYLADIACVALNRLPPRYIRHDVDMTFFMSPQEMQEVNDKVVAAVKEAVAYVTEREAQRQGSNETSE